MGLGKLSVRAGKNQVRGKINVGGGYHFFLLL